MELPVEVQLRTKINLPISSLSRVTDLETLELFFTSGDVAQTILRSHKLSDLGTIHETAEHLPVLPGRNNRLVLRSDLTDRDGIYCEKQIEGDQVGEEKRVDFSPVRRDGASIKGTIPGEYLPDNPELRESIMIGFEHGRQGARYGTFSADENGKFEAHNLPPETTMTMFLDGHTEKFETDIRGDLKHIEFDN